MNIKSLKTEDLKELLLKSSSTDIEKIVDAEIRHGFNQTPADYLNHWLAIARCFAYATKDDSFGEFEKEFTIIIKRMILAERKLKSLGADL